MSASDQTVSDEAFPSAILTGEIEMLKPDDQTWFAGAMNQLGAAQTVVNFVQEVLRQKYGLKEGDTVLPDGRIVRV